LQRELDTTARELDSTRIALAEKDHLLRDRDALLEDSSLESRRMAELLEKERQARRQDKIHLDQMQRTAQHNSRTMAQHESRVAELEAARSADRKKLTTLENSLRDQLTERNNLLLALWNRLSTLCGTDWAHKNSLVNGRCLPSLDVVASQLPGFSKNLLAAVTAIEGLVGGFKSRLRTVERDLWKEYQTLEHTLDTRLKKLDRLEALVSTGRDMSSTTATELAKLKAQNRLLKAELTILQKQDTATRSSRMTSEQKVLSPSPPAPREVGRTVSSATSLMRHNSASVVETLERATGSAAGYTSGTPADPNEQKWLHRLRELERRLKLERELRILDRTGARKRLEEEVAENEELRSELEREKVRKGFEEE
jgi:hypothetical protein